jgi:GTPase Era involved in 16S rRNA processing
MTFEEKKKELLLHLSHLQLLAEEAGSSSLIPKIDAQAQKLSEERFHLVVLGQFKRGKTTLINAILGEPLLPIAVVPLTSVLTLLRYGERKRISVIFLSGDRREISSDELEQYVTERGNPNNEKLVRYVEIEFPCEFLREGVVLIDTPGIGSLFLHNTEITYSFIPHIDAAIFVLSADPPITKTEFDFLKDVVRYVDKVFFVFNKVDMLQERDLIEAVDYNVKVLREEMGNDAVAFLPVSALRALEAKREQSLLQLQLSGLPDAERSIQMFLQQEKAATLLHASLRRIEHLIAELQFETELELKATTMPLDDLDSRIARFEILVNSLQRDRKRFEYLLAGEVTSLQQWIEGELETFAAQEKERLGTTMVELMNQAQELTSAEFQEQAEQRIMQQMVADFDSWRPGNESRIVQKYRQIVGGYVQDINSFVQQFLEQSAQLFDIDVKPFAEIESFVWKKTFYYKVDDDPVFLDIDFPKLSLALLPASSSRKRILRKYRERISEKVMQNCGRLRYEYVYSIQEACRSFQANLDRMISEVVEAIHTTLQKAIQRRKENEAAVRDDIGRVRRRLTQLENIRSQVRTNGART